MSDKLSEDDDLVAAELAFGLLESAERQAAVARLGADGLFADAHARWQTYASAMFSDKGVAPSASVWRAIEARLPANDVVLSTSARSLRWWQIGTAAASAATVVLGVVAVQKPETVIVRVPVAQAPAPPMVAVLTGKTGLVTVSFDPTTGYMTSAASGLYIGARSPELWVIPADGKPRSMGVINAANPVWAKVPARASSAMATGVMLAVSVEPVGGAPTGQPTGPVILTGKLTTT